MPTGGKHLVLGSDGGIMSYTINNDSIDYKTISMFF